MRHAKYLVHTADVWKMVAFSFTSIGCGSRVRSVQGRGEPMVTPVTVLSTIQRERFLLGDPKGVGSEDYPLPRSST